MGAIKRAFANNITTSGNLSSLDAANLIGTLPAISGANLTGISQDWIKLAETNVTTSTASVEFTDATTGVFDGTYRTNVILCRRLVPATANVGLKLEMRDASDTNYESSSYAYATRGIDSSGNERTDYATSGSYCRLLGGGDGMGDGSHKYGTSCVIFCNDFFDSGQPPSYYGNGVYSKQSGYTCSNHFAGTYRDTSIQMDGVRLSFHSGNITQGNFIIYGVGE